MEESNLTPLQKIIVEMIYGPRFTTVRGICEKYAGGIIDADDILQELVTDLLEKNNVKTLICLKEIGMPYLYRSLKNRATDLIRKSTKRSDFNREHGKNIITDDGVAQAELTKERDKLIRPFLKKLKPKPRSVIELVLEGHKNTEIAELMDEHVQTIGTIKARGIEKLQSYLSY